VFPVRHGLNLYIIFRRQSVSKRLSLCTDFGELAIKSSTSWDMTSCSPMKVN
jgi:hypothetical protein